MFLISGGPAILYGAVNGSVHIIMYIYYFLTILQPHKRAYFAQFKPRITEIQLVFIEHYKFPFEYVNSTEFYLIIADSVRNYGSALHAEYFGSMYWIFNHGISVGVPECCAHHIVLAVLRQHILAQDERRRQSSRLIVFCRCSYSINY